jgi:hypothetical protein
MLMNEPPLSDESGTTMIELLVGMAMGMVVLAGLTLTIITVMHGTARVDARVEATDNARVVVTRIMEELHSACTSPQTAPVREGSNGTQLIFWHAAENEANAVVPKPVKSKIVYSNGTLTQTDYTRTGGEAPNAWEFSATGIERKLLINVAPGNGSSVFSYEKFGTNGPTPATTPLTGSEAATVIVVKIALTASPKSSPVADKSSAATVEDGATLRLTPAPYETGVSVTPCK